MYLHKVPLRCPDSISRPTPWLFKDCIPVAGQLLASPMAESSVAAQQFKKPRVDDPEKAPQPTVGKPAKKAPDT